MAISRDYRQESPIRLFTASFHYGTELFSASGQRLVETQEIRHRIEVKVRAGGPFDESFVVRHHCVECFGNINKQPKNKEKACPVRGQSDQPEALKILLMNTMVMISQEELKKLVSSAVTEALEAHEGKPALLDRAGLARALCCSTSHIDVLRKEGLPTTWLGDVPRFVLASVLKWIDGRSDAQQ